MILFVFIGILAHGQSVVVSVVSIFCHYDFQKLKQSLKKNKNVLAFFYGFSFTCLSLYKMVINSQLMHDSSSNLLVKFDERNKDTTSKPPLFVCFN